jgi:small subunit ribosomal protein S10
MRVVIKGYDSPTVDSVTKNLSNMLQKNGLQFSGPIPMPTLTRRFTVLKSPHVDKDARQVFALSTHKRMIQIDESKSAVAALSNAKNVHPCVSVVVKIVERKKQK